MNPWRSRGIEAWAGAAEVSPSWVSIDPAIKTAAHQVVGLDRRFAGDYSLIENPVVYRLCLTLGMSHTNLATTFQGTVLDVIVGLRMKSKAPKRTAKVPEVKLPAQNSPCAISKVDCQKLWKLWAV